MRTAQQILTILIFSAGTAAQAFTLHSDIKNGWRGRTLKININPSNCPAELLAAFNDAAELWNSVSTSYLKIDNGSINSSTTPAALMGLSATDSPVLVCDANFGTTTGADEDVVAGTGFSGDVGGYLVYGGLILNTSAGDASLNNLSRKQMAMIIAHEIGHTLGFGSLGVVFAFVLGVEFTIVPLRPPR